MTALEPNAPTRATGLIGPETDTGVQIEQNGPGTAGPSLYDPSASAIGQAPADTLDESAGPILEKGGPAVGAGAPVEVEAARPVPSPPAPPSHCRSARPAAGTARRPSASSSSCASTSTDGARSASSAATTTASPGRRRPTSARGPSTRSPSIKATRRHDRRRHRAHHLADDLHGRAGDRAAADDLPAAGTGDDPVVDPERRGRRDLRLRARERRASAPWSWSRTSRTASPRSPPYDTGSLPSGGPARTLTVAAAYAEAGVQMLDTGGTNTIATSAGHIWNNASLHDAMMSHFSRCAGAAAVQGLAAARDAARARRGPARDHVRPAGTPAAGLRDLLPGHPGRHAAEPARAAVRERPRAGPLLQPVPLVPQAAS